ncbi:lipocalin family protein [Flavobacterium beibuense]|uniref:Lipocalin_4 domain containing protein n=1 Tax=Flavobacterium beibuense TaxID=657326 RepID=A0A444W7Z8_9FLAO|nr:lipocalin family protein [Flavobacterium beibuense]RYJ41768.1 Lipocalin_4 domain containing protein [Flavobacterium beibuense]
MKKLCLFLLMALATVSCSQKIEEADLYKLNGYWEIKEVIMPDGGEKEYTVNPTIDFFELKGKEGFRQKVMPQVDGTYRTNELTEKIAVSEEDGKTYINYTTDHAKWKEQIIELDDENLVLKNEQDIEYHYHKPEPFTIK